MQFFSRVVAGALVAWACLGSVQAQTYTWTGTTNNQFSNADNWSPNGGPPGGSNTAFFTPSAVAPFQTVFNNPDVDGANAVNSLILAPTATLGGREFSGAGSLVIGGSASLGVKSYGPAEYTLNGPTLEGANTINMLRLEATTGSTLRLTGNSAITNNQAYLNVTGGTLILDNSAVNINNRVLNPGSSSEIVIHGGGTFHLIGNSSGTVTDIGNLNRLDNAVGGRNTIKVTPNGANTTLTTSFNTSNPRGGTRNVLVFEATSGQLGDVNGAQIKLRSTPFINSTSGLLVNTATSATGGWAIVKDSLGTNFATYNGVNNEGLGVVSFAHAQSGVTITTLNDTWTGIGQNNQLNISNGTTVTATTSPAATAISTLRISQGTNATLALGTNNLNTQAIMIDGTADFTITGTGVLGTGTRYLYVNHASTTVSIENPITTGTSPVVFGGPGIVALTSTSLQNTGTVGNNYRITIADGVLRANNTQLGFDTTRGVINLYGGVLEITSGANGTGTSADFRRALGTLAGNVNWGAGNADRGSGGFSAFGSAASVNIGGASDPATLQWNQANFVADGYALRFGSVKSNAVLNWLNPLQLDNGTGYQLREISVTAGTGGDKTVLRGAINGASNADLIKTGTGTLELAAANTYSGNTLIQNGTLLASNTSGSATGTGRVIIGSGATLGGTGTLSPGSGTGGVFVLGGGTLQAGTGTATGSSLTISSETLTFGHNANLAAVVGGGGTELALATDLTVNGATRIVANDLSRENLSSIINVLLTNDGSIDLSGQTTYTRRLVTYTGSLSGGLNNGTYNAASNVFAVDGVNFDIANNWQIVIDTTNRTIDITFTPVPEPATILLAGTLGLAAVQVIRRRRHARTASPSPAV